MFNIPDNKSEVRFKISKSLKGNQRSRKYQLNFDYFKKWSQTMAYLLGLLFADGNINISKSQGHRMALQLEMTRKPGWPLQNAPPVAGSKCPTPL